MNFLTADPGAKGAIAVMTSDCGLLWVHDMPMIKRGGNQHVDYESIDHLISAFSVEFAIIEDVWGQATDAKKSIFTFGRMVGGLEAAIAPHCEIKYITPRKWKSAVGLIGTEKKQSAIKAGAIYGDELFKGPRGAWKDGRGDCVMIGLAAIKLNMLEGNNVQIRG